MDKEANRRDSSELHQMKIKWIDLHRINPNKDQVGML